MNPASPNAGATARPWHLAAICLLLLGVTAGAYINADHEEFLFDSAQPDLLSSPAQNWRHTLHDFWREPLRPGQQLTTATFALNYLANRAVGLDGLDVTGFLAVNVLLHGINACLVFFLLRALHRQFYPDRPVPLLIPAGLALLFAVHPIHASSVAYIIQRRGTLATLFYLLGILAWLRARQAGGFAAAPADARGNRPPASRADRRSPVRFAACIMLTLACFWLAARSKEMALTLPFTLLLVEFALRAPYWKPSRFAALAPGLILTYLLLMSVGLTVIGRLSLINGTASAYGEHLDWGVWSHFLTMCRALAHCWKLLLLPLPGWMSVDHDFALSRSLIEHGVLAAMLLHVALLIAAFAAVRRGYALLGLGILWFYAVQVPYMLLPQRELLVEYKTYLPSIGVMLASAGLLACIRPIWPRRPVAAAFAALAVVLLVLTVRGNVAYQSACNLWSDVLAKSPGNSRAAGGRAAALLRMGRIDEAIEQFRAAVKLTDGDESVLGRVSRFALLNNLGDAYMKAGRPADAATHFLAALKLDPEDPTVLYNLGYALNQIGEHKTAIGFFERLLRVEPESADGHFQAAGAYFVIGRFDLAERHYEEVIRLEPHRALAHAYLGNVLTKRRKMDEALSRYRTALELDPELAEAHKSLGDLLYHLDRRDEALQHYHRAIAIDPAYPEALNNLAGALRVAGGRDEQALELYQRAIGANPDYLPARENLADMLMGQGRIAEALAEYEHILTANPQDPRVRAKLTAATQPTPAQP